MLWALLGKMREHRRATFVLFEIRGAVGRRDCAQVQGIPINTVWTRLYHARKEFFALAAKYQQRARRE